jgi:hypothetical protein
MDDELKRIFSRFEDSLSVQPGAMARLVDSLEREAGPRRSSKLDSPWSRISVGIAAAAVVAAIGLPMVLRSGMDGPGVSLGASVATASSTSEQISHFAHQLTDTASRDDRFVGAVIDQGGAHVSLYGVGLAAPQSVQEIIASAPSGMTISWEEVPFSQAELRRAMALAEEQIPGTVRASYRSFDQVEIGVKLNGRTLAQVQTLADALPTDVPINVVPDAGNIAY